MPAVAIDIPKFFSPNNDGVNDTWEVEDTKNIIIHIYIFDRYGKVLKKLMPNQNWDGNYMGKPMDETDYWYLIQLNTGEKLTGHLSLLRK
jgi:gliding motility-associated-like protein